MPWSSPGDLDASGALLAGKSVNLNLSGDLTNSATIAGKSAVQLTANNLQNIGGRIQGDAVTLKALVTAMVTGGALAGMDFSPTNQPKVNGGAQTFTSQLGHNLQAGVARSLISTAINGGSLEESLKTSITAAFIDTGAAQGAFAIGQLDLNNFTNKVAHALAWVCGGCGQSKRWLHRGCHRCCRR